MKQTIIFGNIITMDEKRPFAKAAVVKNGVFAYIGGAEEAKKLAGADAKVMDYGDNFIYPGFIEAHAHGVFAGYRAIGQANLARGVIVTNTTAPVTDMPDYFGPASFHENDYSFFYKNLQDNVAKRIAAYKAN